MPAAAAAAAPAGRRRAATCSAPPGPRTAGRSRTGSATEVGKACQTLVEYMYVTLVQWDTVDFAILLLY